MSVPLVTVVVPTYDSAATLGPALDSVLGQDFDDFEVYVVGDGCSDASEALVSGLGDPRLRWHNLPRNSGTPSAPRNAALRLARGRFVAYLGHDDLWFPWHLSNLVGALATGGDFACDLGVLCGPDGLEGAFTLPGAAARRGGAYLSPSNWMHSRDLAERLGGWSTRPASGVDWEFLGRLRAAGAVERSAHRLGVLKFPSSRWRLYDPAAAKPQSAWLADLRRDPGGLERHVLTALAETLAGRPPYPVAGRSGLAALPNRVFNALVAVYGRDRWPASRLLRWREHQLRGLAAARRERDDRP
jgi:hypothetical protein